MKPLLIVISFVLLFIVAFAWQQVVPAELQGKWKLSAGNKLIGHLEVKSDGKYSYTVLPNYKETGTITCSAGRAAKEINLLATRISKSKQMNITRGIYRLNGNTLSLCLANVNEPRPANFNSSNASTAILWTGNR